MTLADRDARRTAHALGKAITLTVALALAVIGIVTANGTIPPMLATAAGIGIAVRVWWVANHNHTKETP